MHTLHNNYYKSNSDNIGVLDDSLLGFNPK